MIFSLKYKYQFLKIIKVVLNRRTTDKTFHQQENTKLSDTEVRVLLQCYLNLISLFLVILLLKTSMLIQC